MDEQDEYELTRKRILEERKHIAERLAAQEAARQEQERREREVRSAEERERHEQRLVWAKNEILIERARLDPFGYGFDNKYRSLWEVSDEAAEQKLRELDATKRAQQ
jgi:hypothetical protein